MVQGKSKGLQKKAASARHVKASPKKGLRDIPPKKASAQKHVAIQKSLSSKINRSIERQMVSAASSGKLTIMKNTADASSSKSHAKGPKK